MKSQSFSVNCQWAGWNQYTACSKTCGSGTQSRSRTKTVTEKYEGTCTGLSTETRSCNTQNCPSNFFSVPLALRQFVKLALFLVNCQWGGWNKFSSCTKTCGSGTESRSRSKTVAEQYGGTCAGLSTETSTSNT